MHSDLTLDILDALTTDLGSQFRSFKVNVCAAYDARELDKEVTARSHRQAKEAACRTQAGNKKNSVINALPSNGKGRVVTAKEQVEHNKLRRSVSFNLQTYKIHALGDYVSCI
jgi:hypothetical protein